MLFRCENHNKKVIRTFADENIIRSLETALRAMDEAPLPPKKKSTPLLDSFKTKRFKVTKATV